MSSKLFRAVVGIGISIGTASAACFGATSGAADSNVDGTTVPTPIPAPVHSDAAAAVEPTDAQAPDARDLADAASDAPFDAYLTAFCDAAWPTTKGGVFSPTCGDIAPCADAGRAPQCHPRLSATNCESAPTPAWCVGGGWQCAIGSVPAAECSCWDNQGCP
jgi:hypothetical protein